jgi:hypothetical protein
MSMDDIKFVLDMPPYDIDDDGADEEFRFVLTDNLRIGHLHRTGYIVEGGANAIGAISGLYEDLTGEEVQSDGRGQKFAVDLGGGPHVTEIEGQVSVGSPNRWGTGDGDPVWDQTGAHPLAQAQLLDRVIQLVPVDSSNPATFKLGMYGDEFPALQVAPEEPEVSFDAEQESSTATVSLGLPDIAGLSTPVSQKQDKTR